MDDRVFGIAAKHNKAFAESILARVMGEPGIKVLTVESQSKVPSLGYAPVFDALAITKEGERIAIEVQREITGDFARGVGYRLAALVFGSLPRGSKSYKALPRCCIVYLAETVGHYTATSWLAKTRGNTAARRFPISLT